MKTTKLNRTFIVLGLCCFMAVTACSRKNEQSKTLTAYSERDNKVLRGLYFYPSTIRMLSKFLGDENGEALSEIQKGRVYFSWSDDDKIVDEEIKALKEGVKNEGFEMLMQMNSSGNKVDIYLQDREIDDYMLFVKGADGNFVLEILGNLSPSTLRNLSQLDIGKMMNLLELEMPVEAADIDSLNIN